MIKKEDIKIVLDRLEASYPDAECALDHRNVFELIVAVSLSAQTTDVSVNKVTPALFAKYPDAESLAKADIKDLEDMLRTIGMYRNKAKNVKALGLALAENYGGEVPQDYHELVKLPGVGRKTANVVLSVGFGEQRIAVDTHVFRVSNRIGLVNEKDVLKTELKLMERIPKERWSKTHHSLIFHGRNCCSAKKPKCKECPILELCQYKDKEI